MIAFALAIASATIAEWVSPWEVLLIEPHGDCTQLCGNWSALYLSDSGCKGVDMLADETPKFCPDMEKVEAWTVDDEENFVAMYHRADELLKSENEIYQDMVFERIMKLSVHPWQKFQFEQVRTLIERRRTQGSASNMRCIGGGPNIGNVVRRYKHGRPSKVSLSFQNKNGEDIISYFEMKYTTGKMGGGTPDVGTSIKGKLPTCTTVVFGKTDDQHVNALKFISQGKETRLMGDDINDSVIYVAPSGKCLGDIRMRYDELVNRICFRFNEDE